MQYNMTQGPVTLINLQAVTADPGATLSTAVDLAGVRDISFHLYLLGGTSVGPVNRTVTVTFWAYQGLTTGVGVVKRLVNITRSGHSLTDYTYNNALFGATGATAVDWMVDFDNINKDEIYVQYDWDSDPSLTNGSIVVTYRTKAL
jgi:hypothetical protein